VQLSDISAIIWILEIYTMLAPVENSITPQKTMLPGGIGESPRGAAGGYTGV
jgi:hypothetical protein